MEIQKNICRKGIENPDITIIVTVHNSEEFLDECLQSVCSQTYENIEIICVDGGSTDRSPDILREYARKDSRIRIINDPNTSYGHKLNRGFMEAKGIYVGILESDDMLYNDMAENLIKVADSCHADIIGGNISQFFDYKDGRYRLEIKKYPDSYYNRMIINGKDNLVYRHGSIYNSIYRKKFLIENHIKLNETPGAAFQDQGFSFLTDILFQTAFYIDKPVYYYRIDNPESSVYNDKKIFEDMWEMQFIEKELLKRKITAEEIWDEFWKNKYDIYILKMRSFSKLSRDQFKEIMKKELDSDLKKGILDKNIFNEKQKNTLLSFHRDIDYFEKNDIQIRKVTKAQKYYNIIDKVNKRETVIFGAGKRGKFIGELLGSNINSEIKCYCDNAYQKYENGILGKQVMSVTETVNKFPDAVYVIANKKNSDEMREQLESYGIKDQNIYVSNL